MSSTYPTPQKIRGLNQSLHEAQVSKCQSQNMRFLILEWLGFHSVTKERTQKLFFFLSGHDIDIIIVLLQEYKIMTSIWSNRSARNDVDAQRNLDLEVLK